MDEQTWWRQHPDPQVTPAGDRLVLWNYPVGKTDLADAHAAAIDRFVGVLVLGGPAAGQRLSIAGHASGSGEASANVVLARGRADNASAHLRALGFEGFEVSSEGSSHPADTGSTGQALARNRRVELTLSTPTVEPVLRPRDDPSPSRRPPAPVPAGAALSFEYEFDLPLGTFRTPATRTTFTAVVRCKGRVVRGDGAAAAALSAKHKGLSAKFEAKLGEHIKAKVGVEPGKTGKPPTAKVSLAGETFGFPVESGFQVDPQFYFIKVTFPMSQLDEIDIGSAVLSLQLSVDVKAEIGPSEGLMIRLAGPAGVAGTVGTAGAAGAAGVGVAVVAGTIIGGTIWASDASKKKMARTVVDLSERAGAAGRVAFECLGATARADVAFRAHRLDMGKAGGESSRAGFQEGDAVVAEYLHRLGSGRSAKIAAWKQRYARDLNETDYDRVCETVLAKLRPYENEPQPLRPLLDAL